MSTIAQSLPLSIEAKPDLSTRPSHIRIDFLDGIRGMAALYVMLGHVFAISAFDDGKLSTALSPTFLFATKILSFPRYAVAVFIVLSGFCLMIPVAKSESKQLAGGFAGFVKRRARRILPPYYVALLLFLGAHYVTNHAHLATAEIPASNIVAHLLLIHNLFPAYNMSIDSPMWSVAMEWQIYFVFALALIPIWRRLRIVWTVVIANVLGLLPVILLPHSNNFDWTSPWYLGFFALGMGAAEIVRGGGKLGRLAVDSRSHAIALGSILAIFAVIQFSRPDWLRNSVCLGDYFVGLLAAVFIVACANTGNQSIWRSIPVKFLESRVMMALGAFSYSLYLIHYPVLQRIDEQLRTHHRTNDFQFVFLLGVGVPISLALAYLFHLAFERPFMPGHPKTERQAEIAAIVSPAP